MKTITINYTPEEVKQILLADIEYSDAELKFTITEIGGDKYRDDFPINTVTKIQLIIKEK